MNNLVDITTKKSKKIHFQAVAFTENDHFDSDGTFLQAIAPVIRFVQCFGILPVRNCLSSDLKATTFKWISIPSMISLFCCTLGLIEFILYLCMQLKKNLGLDELNSYVYFLGAIGGYFCFLRIAMNWKSLMTQWCNTERVFLQSPYKLQQYRLKVKLRIYSVIFLVLGLAHEGLSLGRRFYSTSILIKVCHLEPNLTKYTFQIVRPYIYAFTGYNHIIGIIYYYSYISIFLCMTSANLFSVLASLAIAERFKQFNERLASVSYQQVAGSFWTECRVHHQKLTQLVKLANKYFGPLILVVCFNDVYFMSMQIFRITKVNLPFAIDKIYFAYSFSFLMSSLWLIFSCAAQINELSKKSVLVLPTIPKESWNIEAKRFMWQLQEERVALSGCNLFEITRGLILRMTATIITYEIMLFDNLNYKPPDFSKICALLRDNRAS